MSAKCCLIGQGFATDSISHGGIINIFVSSKSSCFHRFLVVLNTEQLFLEVQVYMSAVKNL